MASTPSVAPSPRWAADAPLSRALVTSEDADAAGPSAWWACSVVCAGHQRRPPLDAPTVGSAAGAIEASDSPTLLTPTQLELLRSHQSVVYTARGVAPTTPSCSDGRASVAQFSREYVYDLSALASRADRTFRKACRRAETALAERSLHVEVLAGGAVTEQALERCAACRLRWMERRAADARAAAKRAGRKYEGPPYAGATKRGFLDAAASLSAVVDVALFVLSEPPACTAAAVADPPAYLLTEVVGRTVVAVEGCHDFSVSGIDPSALLLFHAARWHLDRGGDTPLWLNDGPVPTAGLLAYKSQYHGELLEVLILRPEHQVRAAARARWRALLAAWRRARRTHVGRKKIRRAAMRIYLS